MKVSTEKMSKHNMVYATERAKEYVRSWIELAREVTEDVRKEARLKNCQCKACFYSSRIGCAAMTERDCMSCGESQLYGSTSTDVLCLPCANKHKLCSHCGGDLEMRIRRKNWPMGA